MNFQKKKLIRKISKTYSENDISHHTSNEEVIPQTDANFEDLPKSYFLDGLKNLEKRLEKCIELKGDYVEK